ncbi:MAG: hypothetical protein HKP58_14695 [Desulfatitalea sp.]|nr:hypothetical protein [Desulfatitalea sp.]NNK01655.1 hypothetical protein [Desulfatitalea sp.]
MLLVLPLKRLVMAVLLVAQITVPAAAGLIADNTADYDRLLEWIQLKDLEGPLVLMADESGRFDHKLNRENIAYLNNNRDLIQNVLARLDAVTLKWKLAASSKRLLVVPESRREYAELFERYCKDAVHYALERTRLPNPYLRIATLEMPSALTTVDVQEGVTAFLVHNIADEYVEEYLFFNQENTTHKVKIKLANRVFTGRIGAYTSNLTIGEDFQISFEKEPYTVWQNSAENPINVLVAPVEETLHIALRTATEKAIRNRLHDLKPDSIQSVKAVVDEWMAVEEAIVGGLVADIMPEIFARLLHGSLESQLAHSLNERQSRAQYHLLHQGIRVVSELGLHQAIALYTSQPDEFQKMISTPQLPETEQL